MVSIDTLVNGRTGPILNHDLSGTDFDDALVVYDRYESLTTSIVEQYASITDALHALKTQITANKDKDNGQ